MADESDADKEARQELEEAQKEQARAMEAAQKEEAAKSQAPSAGGGGGEGPQNKPSRWKRAASWGLGKAKSGAAVAWSKRPATINVSFVGVAAVFLLLFEYFNFRTGFANFYYRFFGELFVFILLIFIGTPFLSAFWVAILDYFVPEVVIKTLILKTPPIYFFFLKPIADITPNFTGSAQTALTAIVLVLSPALIYVFVSINSKIEPHVKEPVYRFARAVYLVIFVIAIMTFFFSSLALAGVESAKLVADVTTLSPEGQILVKNAWNSTFSPTAIARNVRGLFQAQVQIATGGEYYASQMEQTKAKPTGVFIKNFESLQKSVREGDPVVFYADISVLTLEKESIDVSTNCSATVGTETIQGDATPKSFKVELTGTETVECKFPNGLKKGLNAVNFTATFPFVTDAYNRAYFMEKNRLVALSRSGINPYDQFPVPDRNPITVYTSGPLSIGMDVQNPIPVDATSIQFLGVSLKNEWKGGISKLNNVFVDVPNGITIGDNDCGSYIFKAGPSSDVEGYKKYALSDLNRINSGLQQFPFQSFRCKLTFSDPNVLLGSEALAKKFFFAKADYVYSLVSSTSIDIKPKFEETPPVP